MTDSAKVPGAARAYFDGGDVRDVFTEDAVVRDDGRTYVGIEEIVAWKSAVSTAFTFTQKIESVNTPGSAVVVSVKVEGDFPGSPVQLHHHFTLDGDRISALTVCP
ncbi:MAG: nuclear transport factor 2 family protein [Rhodococcus sp. (in: high G+C Gram-positive bacteria)]|uniref:nuclear transport factor 2 family protein n=1 Tax=Rhodococcus TaxID=1827 RepID=UPI001E2E221D|nr:MULTISPECIES: nuclear transport factor 2 family protein [Rhodococcus erythropolis group]MCD2105730.1 nuclear transport factor 2 family protein [Rhodococcus qingshengii]MCZ4523664.1 nuclear transport factor 2 family protein [Rhodococcus erythropolis]MDZ7916208.1 nuclear transport factor 2 family protein [Rhodococcus sp. (in: high G+C Gram-positive bacteria)]